MTVLVLGENGQLAMHLREVMPDAAFWGRRTLDLADTAAIGPAITALRPTVIVNAAGYTAVDKAESEPELAWRINADAVAAIARTASTLGAPLVHVSSDYVFDGTKVGEYQEQEALNPLNVYGLSKAAGELAVRALCPRSWTVRVSWLFSEHGANFMKTVLRLAEKEDTLRVVDDQLGRPTYAGHLARVIARLVDVSGALPYGILHAVGGPVVSWRGFADEVVARAYERGLLARRPTVRRIRSSEYPVAAERPLNSVLRPSADLEKLLESSDWRDGLNDALSQIGEAA